MSEKTDDCLHLPLQVSADTEEVAFAETDRQKQKKKKTRSRTQSFVNKTKKEPSEFSFMYILYIFFWGVLAIGYNIYSFLRLLLATFRAGKATHMNRK